MKVLLLLALLCPAALATSFQDCGSEASAVTFVVEGCDIPPCIVERGSSFLVTITFVEHHEIQILKANVTAEIGGIDTPWPGFDHDGCSYLVEGCPIAASSTATWVYLVEVLPEYPLIETMVTITLWEEGNDHIEVCIQAPVQIV